MKIKKIIRLINNEQMNRKVISSKGCDDSSYDWCLIQDYGHCVVNAYDSCISKDFKYCHHSSKDYCSIDGDFVGCSYGPNDYD